MGFSPLKSFLILVDIRWLFSSESLALFSAVMPLIYFLYLLMAFKLHHVFCVCSISFASYFPERSLGVHISKVKSITLDDWEPESIKVRS